MQMTFHLQLATPVIDPDCYQAHMNLARSSVYYLYSILLQNMNNTVVQHPISVYAEAIE